MVSKDQVPDHPNPDILINQNIAETKVAAEDAAKRPRNYETAQLARHRINGWTAERQRTFLAALADTGRVLVAAEAAGISPRSCYRLRRHPRGAAFARAWDDALRVARNRKPVAPVSVHSNRSIMTMLHRMLPQILGQTGPGNRSVAAPSAPGGEGTRKIASGLTFATLARSLPSVRVARRRDTGHGARDRFLDFARHERMGSGYQTATSTPRDRVTFATLARHPAAAKPRRPSGALEARFSWR